MTRLADLLRTLYVAAAVAGFAATFMPLYAFEVADAADGVYPTETTYSLWSSLGIDDGRGNAVIGIVLVLALLGGALAASTGGARRSPSLLVGGAAVIAVIMLANKPGTSTGSFGPGAGGMLGAAIVLLGTALVDLFADPWSLPDESAGSPPSDRRG